MAGEAISEIVEAAGMCVYITDTAELPDTQWYSVAAPGLWFGVVLDGAINTSHADVGAQVWQAGTRHAFWSDGRLKTLHSPHDAGALSGVFVHVAPESIPVVLGPGGADFVSRMKKKPLVENASDTETALSWSMIGSGERGLKRRLQIAGRAMELLASGFERLAELPAGETGIAELTPREVRKLYSLRKDLLTRLADPPTVAEFAREAGMNQRKLNAGFLTLFGHTVSGLAKRARLDRARSLLEHERCSIAQAAYAVGYDPAHFSVAFRERFGHAPSVLKRKTRDRSHREMAKSPKE